MWRNRILYLIALLAVTVFYGFFYGWFSEYLWWLILALPLLSLAVSLPAMLSAKPKIYAPALVQRGDAVTAHIVINTALPAPCCKYRLTVKNSLSETAQSWKKKPRQEDFSLELSGQHSGRLECSFRRVWVYDYLGLFAIPRRWKNGFGITVLPSYAAPQTLPSITQLLNPVNRPKPGGGYAESYELREYRPGDSLRQIHWKLTAKGDETIVREPQEPIRGQSVLSLALAGSPDEMDLTMDKAMFLSRWLLERELPHRVQWLSGDELRSLDLKKPEELSELAKALAESRPSAPDKSPLPEPGKTVWHYHVQADS